MRGVCVCVCVGCGSGGGGWVRELADGCAKGLGSMDMCGVWFG